MRLTLIPGSTGGFRTGPDGVDVAPESGAGQQDGLEDEDDQNDGDDPGHTLDRGQHPQVQVADPDQPDPGHGDRGDDQQGDAERWCTESSGPAPGRAQDREEREQPDHGHEQDPTEDGGDVAADQIVDHIVRDAYDTPDRSLVDVEHVDEDALPPQQAGQCHDERGDLQSGDQRSLIRSRLDVFQYCCTAIRGL